MNPDLLNPWFLLELQSKLCLLLLGIVVLGIISGCICLVFLCLWERR